MAATAIHRRVDRLVSSHDFDAPKESASFWTALERDAGFDPERTLLVEDSVIVEAKATIDDHPVFKAQILTHMKLKKIRLGCLSTSTKS